MSIEPGSKSSFGFFFPIYIVSRELSSASIYFQYIPERNGENAGAHASCKWDVSKIN